MVRSDLPTVVCPECGAENNTFANVCWICRHPLYAEAELVDAELAPVVGPPSQSAFGKVMAMWSFVLLVLGVALIGLGVISESLEAAIPYGLISLPLLVIVAALMFKGNQSENPTLRAFSMILSTIIVTVGTMLMLGIAVIIALFAFCMMLLSGL